MSIILKGNNISSSNNNGIGPGEVTNIKASQNASSIILSWTNPSNVVIDGTTLSTFDHVIIVRNEERYPMSAKDGKIVYSGNGTTCTDSDVIKNKKYYYRFFVYDTNKLCNNNMSMIIENTFYGIDPILKNNTWSQIAAASESGIASSLWKVGDEIDLTLSGDFNETVTLQIWDFNHFDKSDGSGKAGICFGMKNLMKDKQQMTPDSIVYNNVSWIKSSMRTNIMQKIFKSTASDLQPYIKEVNTYTSAGFKNSAASVGILTTDKIFIPGFTELFGAVNSTQSQTESGQYQFPIFTDNNSRVKKLSNGQGYIEYWWTRSPFYDSENTFLMILSDGSTDIGSHYSYNTYYPYNKYAVCFCFNI